jgi:uncharacterized lipoprotein YddW (UPF0748 family)
MKRKEFLKLMGTSALGLAALPLLGAQRAGAQAEPAARKRSKNWVWMEGDLGSDDAWKRKFAEIRGAGIDAVLLRREPEFLRKIIPVAKQEGLEVHAWIFTLMRAGMEQEHPDWYAVNRNGESTASKPPYVDYYKFMTPCLPAVQEYLVKDVSALAEIDGLQSIHLDYIRHPDVILPKALWPKYNLVQDKEYPQFDYGYDAACRAQYKAKSGVDPLEIADPPADAAWREFRWGTVTALVNQLSDAVHAKGKTISAAVFPTPTIARSLVRQDWPSWKLDMVMPMLYHSFYLEDVAWIEGATREGVSALAGRAPLYAGLFVPELSPDQLAAAVRHAFAGGAQGVSLFEAKVPSAAHWSKLKEALAGS